MCITKGPGRSLRLIFQESPARSPRKAWTSRSASQRSDCRRCSARVERHHFERLTTEIGWVRHTIRRQADESSTKRDLQITRVVALNRHVGIKRLPYGLECLLQGVEQFWTVGD